MPPVSKVLQGQKELGHQRKGIGGSKGKQQQVQRCVDVKEHGLLEERRVDLTGSSGLCMCVYACILYIYA